MLTTQKQVRAAFWESTLDMQHKDKRKLPNGDYSADTRCAFVDFVDMLHRDGQISDALAQRVTL